MYPVVTWFCTWTPSPKTWTYLSQPTFGPLLVSKFQSVISRSSSLKYCGDQSGEIKKKSSEHNSRWANRSWSILKVITLIFNLMDYPIQINTISMEFYNLYSLNTNWTIPCLLSGCGSFFFIKWCISIPEDSFHVNCLKQCRSLWNAPFCGISSAFAEVAVYWDPEWKG